MQVGDLVVWENSGGEYEQGIILEVCDELYLQGVKRQVDYLVYFFLDKGCSVMPDNSLELVECSK